MRVIFLIGREPPPQLADKDHWSLPFHDFVGQCLQKVWALPLPWGSRDPGALELMH